MAPVQRGTQADGALALSSSNVFWSSLGTNGAIYKCPRAGCGGTPKTLATNQLDPKSIALNGTSVYWTTADAKIMACTDDCPSGPTTLATEQHGAGSVVFDASMIYWANQEAGTIMRCNPSSCDPVAIASGITSRKRIAVGGNRIYFSTNSGSIYSVAK